MELKEFLGGVQQVRREITRLEWELRTLRGQCQRATTRMECGPRGGGDVHRDGILAELADRQEELTEARLELRRQEREMEDFLGRLSDFRYRAVLRLRYGDGLRWGQVKARMEELGLYYSDRQIYNFHRRALREAERLWKERNTA